MSESMVLAYAEVRSARQKRLNLFTAVTRLEPYLSTLAANDVQTVW